MENLTTQAENLPTKTLAELKVEIKFHLGQMAGHAVEIGKCLIQAKEQVGHGNFGKWVEENFSLSHKMATNFMNVAERFSNWNSSSNFNQSQLIAMLALPAGEEENFIAEKAAEGTPVEEMTVKKLREEVTKWKEKVTAAELDRDGAKAALKVANEQSLKLQEENEGLEKQLQGVSEHSATLQSENARLQDELKNQKPVEKIVAPEDYEPLKAEKVELQGKIAELEKKLREKPIEIKNTAELDKAKKDLEELQAQFEEMEKCAVIVQTLENISTQIDSIFFTPLLSNALAYYEKFDSVAYKKFVSRVSDFANNINKE